MESGDKKTSKMPTINKSQNQFFCLTDYTSTVMRDELFMALLSDPYFTPYVVWLCMSKCMLISICVQTRRMWNHSE